MDAQPSLRRRWVLSCVLLLCCSSGACRTSPPAAALPPGTRSADGSQTYQVGPEHPLAQQAQAIRAAAQAK